MADARRIVIVGIPGVGKTTVVEKLAQILKKKNRTVRVVSFGTEMLNYAKRNGVANRDSLRKMSHDEQNKIQLEAARSIQRIKADILVIDTHAFIATPSGYYPGLPSPILDIVRPTHFISLTARPEMIFSRRERDKTRNRDKNSISLINRELSIQDAMLSSCAVHSGSPIMPVLNRDGRVEETARQIIKAMEQ